MVEIDLYELCDAVSYLVKNGKKFCVDFGYDTAVEKANELKNELGKTRHVTTFEFKYE